MEAQASEDKQRLRVTAKGATFNITDGVWESSRCSEVGTEFLELPVEVALDPGVDDGTLRVEIVPADQDCQNAFPIKADIAALHRRDGSASASTGGTAETGSGTGGTAVASTTSASSTGATGGAP